MLGSFSRSSPHLSKADKEANFRRVLSTNSLKQLNHDIPFIAVPGLPRISAEFDQMMQQEQFSSNSIPEIIEQQYTPGLILASFVSLLSAFQFGYNTSVINSAESVIFPDHTNLKWSIVVSIFGAGGLIGAYGCGAIAHLFGRKQILLGSSCILIIAGIVMAFATNINILIVGRLLVGIGCGTATVFVPLYLGEISPPSLRGTLGTCNQFSVVIGILVADILAFPLAKTHLWRYLLGFTVIPSALQLLMSCFLLESPRFLLMNSKNDEASKILRKLRDTDDVSGEVESILYASQSDERKNETSLIQAFKFGPTRFALLIGIGLQIAQQWSGINAVFYYSSSFFEETGVMSDAKLGTLLVGIVNVLAVAVAVSLMDKAGRKRLLLISSFGMAISCIVITSALFLRSYAKTPFNLVALIFVLIYVIFFEIGLGPIPWLIIAELFPSNIRASGVSIATVVNWVCNCIIGLAYPYDTKNLHKFSWIPFCAILVTSFFMIWKYVFETKGKTLEQIEKQLYLIASTETSSSLVYQPLVQEPAITDTHEM